MTQIRTTGKKEQGVLRPVPSASFVIALVLVITVGVIGMNRYSVSLQKKSDSQWASIPIRKVDGEDHILGSLTSPIRMVVFTDLECPYCERQHTKHIPLLQKKYGSDLAIVYRHFPNTIIHPTSRKAAEAWECVSIIGGERAFWGFTDAFYALSSDSLVPQDSDYRILAESVGVDPHAFDRCLSEDEVASRVGRDIVDGSLAGVTATPSQVIERDGRRIMVKGSNPTRIETAIDLLLAEHRKVQEEER